jgi:sirohydrochlorin ferrochelatase
MPTASAFLDLTEPDLETTAATLAAQGHRRAVIVPLLFTSAFHATIDVPEAVAAATAATGMDLLTAEILGTGADLVEVLQQSMRRANIGSGTSVLLFSVGSSDAAANDAVEGLATELARTRSGVVRGAFGTRDPRATAVLAELAPPVAIVPLFVSPGLLLDPLITLAESQSLTVAPPLGDLMAPLLLRRYRQRLSQES